MFLLDTMVASENGKRHPSPAVMNWRALYQDDQLFISVMTLAEISYGIQALVERDRWAALESWRSILIEAFAGRILAIDPDIADRWGQIRRRCEIQRRTMSLADLFLAATAEVHGLTLVTRNVRDFEAWGGPVLNPYQASL